MKQQRFKDIYSGRVWIVMDLTATARGEDGPRIRMRDESDPSVQVWFSLPLSEHPELKEL